MVARGRHREKEDGGSRVCNRDTVNNVENIEASTIVSNHDDYVEVLKIHCNTLYYAQIAICNFYVVYFCCLLPPPPGTLTPVHCSHNIERFVGRDMWAKEGRGGRRRGATY